MLPVVSLFDNVARRLKPILNNVPLCFEDMDINHGLVLYETNLPPIGGLTKLPLVIKSLGDRAIFFIIIYSNISIINILLYNILS